MKETIVLTLTITRLVRVPVPVLPTNMYTVPTYCGKAWMTGLSALQRELHGEQQRPRPRVRLQGPAS
jgi:hypothetical protein